MLTNNIYADVLEKLIALDKPLLVTGGGGYNIDNTVRAWALVWTVLCGDRDEHENIGMGGVMLESTDWRGGLRDRVAVTDERQRAAVDTEISDAINAIKEKVFRIHGI